MKIRDFHHILLCSVHTGVSEMLKSVSGELRNRRPVELPGFGFPQHTSPARYSGDDDDAAAASIRSQFISSWNHTLVWIGQDLKDHSVPTPIVLPYSFLQWTIGIIKRY